MRTASRHAIRVTAVLMLGGLALGCAGEDTPEASHSAAPSQEEVAYYRCLEKQGIVLQELDNSQLRVDKNAAENDEATQTRAQTACQDLLPKAGTEAPTAEQLAKAREFSACVRAQGIKDYPDPAPTTGDTPRTET
ncbi:hypothetical protein ACFW96_38590, partial [Streptomyces gardneri]|uniref:hypothetical protein n=1 Tax=Streptomyces gardneri TaxID=66892 RepID=UPI0036A33CEF